MARRSADYSDKNGYCEHGDIELVRTPRGLAMVPTHEGATRIDWLRGNICIDCDRILDEWGW